MLFEKARDGFFVEKDRFGGVSRNAFVQAMHCSSRLRYGHMKKSLWIRAIFLFLAITSCAVIGLPVNAHAWGQEGPMLDGISQSEFDAYRRTYGSPGFGAGCMPFPYPGPGVMVGPADCGAYTDGRMNKSGKARVRTRKSSR